LTWKLTLTYLSYILFLDLPVHHNLSYCSRLCIEYTTFYLSLFFCPKLKMKGEKDALCTFVETPVTYVSSYVFTKVLAIVVRQLYFKIKRNTLWKAKSCIQQNGEISPYSIQITITMYVGINIIVFTDNFIEGSNIILYGLWCI
jgi:hypothetical protein